MDESAALLVFAALSHPTRLTAWRLLARHEPAGLPAGDIADQLATPQNTLSTHLAILTRAGLTTSDRRGRQVIYRAAPARLHALSDYLLQDCCGGRGGCGPTAAAVNPTGDADGTV